MDRCSVQALRISDTERNQQLQHLSKTCADLAESNRGWDIRCNCLIASIHAMNHTSGHMVSVEVDLCLSCTGIQKDWSILPLWNFCASLASRICS